MCDDDQHGLSAPGACLADSGACVCLQRTRSGAAASAVVVAK